MKPKKLEQLTSLRFFAAAMIVVLHCAGKWGVSTDQFRPFALGQGVSFFFVLSGFILAYVYPELPDRRATLGFMRARIARIWPMHVCTLLLAVALPLATKWNGWLFVGNLILIHDWIPVRDAIFSFNAPSWTISAELFFYLCFPILIVRGRALGSLFVAAGVVALLLGLEAIAPSPIWQDLIEFHPVARIFEFVLGVWICSRYRSEPRQWSLARANAYEFGALSLCLLSLHFIADAANNLRLGGTFGVACAAWVEQSGSMFAFGALIYVMAVGCGTITKVFSAQLLVVLGEMSFSMYLLHQLLLRYYEQHRASIPDLSNGASLATFWALILILSAVAMFAIERPMRRLLLGSKSISLIAVSGNQ